MRAGQNEDIGSSCRNDAAGKVSSKKLEQQPIILSCELISTIQQRYRICGATSKEQHLAVLALACILHRPVFHLGACASCDCHRLTSETDHDGCYRGLRVMVEEDAWDTGADAAAAMQL